MTLLDTGLKITRERRKTLVYALFTAKEEERFQE